MELSARFQIRSAVNIFVLPISLLTGCVDNSSSLEPIDISPRVSVAQSGYLGIEPIEAPSRPFGPEVALGKKLFHDPRLSADNTISCASCHVVNEGGDDGRQFSIGFQGRSGEHNAPTVLNAGYNFAQFWDGRVSNLFDQVDGPVHNHVEMAANWDLIIKRLRGDKAMVSQFRHAGFRQISEHSVKSAIVAYESVLVTPNSKFDRFLTGHEDALTLQEREGYAAFMDLGCISCHQGRNVGGNLFQKFGVYDNYYLARDIQSQAAYGRYNVTGLEEDKYVFKVPSLRNVAETAPYFHDGSVATLEEAVRIMSEYQLGSPISDDQLDNLVAFLQTLTGEVPEELL